MNDTIETLGGKPIITCKRSKGSKFADLKLFGKSEQFKTTGKNLLKIKDATQTVRGITVTSKDGILSAKGTATETGWAYVDIGTQNFEDGTYIASISANNNNNNSKLVLASSSFKEVCQQNVATTFTNAEISRICFTVTEGKTYNITDAKIQLEKGSEATYYEPYTGGQPSPSPDYPQEIKSVVNPVVKISNGDGTESQTVALPYTLNAIPVSSGGNYTDENGQQWIADYVDVKRGKLVRCVETATFDGSEDEKWNLSTNNNARMFTTTTFHPFSKASITEAPYIISNMFKFINVNWGAQNRNRIYIEASGRLNIEAPDIEDVDYLKTLLKAENLICHAYRGKTTEIDLTPDEITALKSLHTYAGVTNVSNDAGAWMQVGYRKVR